MNARLVALLRGINVGRNKRMAMSELRDLLRGLGYSDVVTYLQSGNAVFTCPSSTASVASRIEQAMARDLGVESTVIVRTGEDLARIVAVDPLLDLVTDPARHLVGFLAGRPKASAVRALDGLDLNQDIVRLVGREVYLWCPAGVLDSAFAKVAWDRQLGVAVTMRNWNTVTRLAALANP
ncbi:MAG: DUF1697 domain-containing protein [Candidatus Dormibacteria bacterium]